MKVKSYLPEPKFAVRTGLIVIGALIAYQVIAQPAAAAAARKIGATKAADRLAA